MLHADKANGQQGHDRTREPVILRALLLVIFLSVAGLSVPIQAKTAVLRDVRMGNHGEYIRVVFEFSAAVQYELSENTATGNVSIRFLDTTSQLTGAPVSDALACIDTVSAVQDGDHIVTHISFDSKGIKLNPFMIQGPDRVVLDVFCEAVPVAAAEVPASRKISTEIQDMPPEPVTETEPAPLAVAEVTESREISTETRGMSSEPIKETEPALDKPEAAMPFVVEPTASPKVTTKQEDTSQRYLLLLLAAITGVIVLLIAVIIFQKRSLSERQAAGNPDTARDTDKMMYDIDTKIKEKLMKYDE